MIARLRSSRQQPASPAHNGSNRQRARDNSKDGRGCIGTTLLGPLLCIRCWSGRGRGHVDTF